MNTTQKRRWLWIGGILLAAWYFGPSIINSYRQDAYRKAVAARQAAAAQAAKAASPLPASGAAAALPAEVNQVLGVWQGAAPLPTGMCNLRLELRRKADNPAQVAGFPVLICTSIPSILPGQVTPATQQAMMAKLTPVSAVLTGTFHPDPDSLQFTVDKVTGTSVNGCALTSLTVTPFGVDMIAAEWQEGTCEGGHLLLKRMGK
jgi:hypothetical protein